MNAELPPISSDLALFHVLLPTDERDTYWRVINSIEARERILLARIAELEADAARYRWLRDNAAYSLSLTKDDHKICYETAAERIERDAMNPACNPYDETRPEELEKMASLDSIWSVYVYPITPIGHNCYHGATLDAAIDAAREAKP